MRTWLCCWLLLAPLAARGDGQRVEDGRGFSFEVPAGFVPFPGFEPTPATVGPGKLYAYGKELGSPHAVIVALDAVAPNDTPGSLSCRQLMLDIARTAGGPITERWQGKELVGERMVMTHSFGEVLVFCVDVPLTPDPVSVRVSGKPQNEALLRETFRSLLATLSARQDVRQVPSGVRVLGAIVLATLVGLVWRWVRRRRV